MNRALGPPPASRYAKPHAYPQIYTNPVSDLILASGSGIRRAMLEQVGLDFRTEPSQVDEGSVKANHVGTVGALTAKLALAKAQAVSRSDAGAFVIGSDSIAVCEDRALDKPKDREEAAEHLRFFAGKSLILNSSVVLCRGDETLFRCTDSAELCVRNYSESFIQSYLDLDWPAVGHCVGVFRLEGPGPLLFDKISGSHFTVLGMPLLPLLGALRDYGLLPE